MHRNQKKAGMSIMISEKLDFHTKIIFREKNNDKRVNRCRKSIQQNSVPNQDFKKDSFSKLCIEGNFSNLIKAIYEKPTASVILNGERLKDFSLLRSSKIEMPDFTTAIQLCSGSSSQRH